MRENYEKVDLMGGDTVDAARWGLVALMSAISEDCWCATWMSGNEYALWKVKPGTAYGQGEITERQSRLLSDLSAECGGWFRWDVGLTFVPIADWERHVAEEER